MAKIKKTAVKCCPLCQLKVGVACKTCPGCKHSYFNAKRPSLPQTASSSEESSIGRRRRTERVKEKPNFYDASEYEKKVKKKTLVIGTKELRGRPLRVEPLKKKKKKIVKKEKEEAIDIEEEEDPPPVLTAEKARQCSVILAEINRKFLLTTWRV